MNIARQDLKILFQIIPGQWHSISVKRWHQDSILVLDNDPEVSLREKKMMEYDISKHILHCI